MDAPLLCWQSQDNLRQRKAPDISGAFAFAFAAIAG
jgi:hypothetical protein